MLIIFNILLKNYTLTHKLKALTSIDFTLFKKIETKTGDNTYLVPIRLKIYWLSLFLFCLYD